MKARLVAIAACVAVTAALVGAVPAGAHSQTIKDRNDVPGPLDIGRITARHGSTKITHTIETRSRFSSRLLRRNNFLLGWFSTDGDKIDAERLLYIFFQGGRLRGFVANTKGVIQSKVRVTRPNRRTVKWSFGRNQVTSGGGYAWGAFSYYKARGRCSNFCIDAAPNRAPAWLDYSPPVVDMVSSAPNGLSTDLSAYGEDIPIEIVAMDRGAYTGPSWKLQRRALGSSTWTTVDSGQTTTNMVPQIAYVDVLEGQAFDFRVVVDDGPHTSTSSLLRLIGPTDDESLSTEAFTGTWGTATEVDDYLTTVHYSSTATDMFTHEFTGSEIWIIGAGGTASVTVDGGASVPVTPESTNRSIVFHTNGLAASELHEVIVTVTGGTVFIDGVATR